MNSQQGLFRYLTIDEVNAIAAQALAEQHGVALELAEPRDLPQAENERALVILDWDSLPPDNRTRFLNSKSLRIVAVHSYGLSDSLASFLLRRGVLHFKQLGPEMFASIKGMAAAA